MDKRHREISDAWSTQKSKVAFVAAVCELEAQYLHAAGHENEAFNLDARWGAHFILREALDAMDEVIDGPELRAIDGGKQEEA